MKTDALFYELFRIDPKSLFELAHLSIEGEYVFESMTVKTTEKRFDGFFRRIDGKGFNIFLEVQGYDDPVIYWRLFREVCTWYEQNRSKEPFIAIVLFIDETHAPKDCPFAAFTPPNQLITVSLTDALKSIQDSAGVLTVLKPLIFKSKTKLPQVVPKWKAEINSLKLPEYKLKILTDLLEYAILQRFPNLSLKEIKEMIRLTPLEKTVAGQELIQLGIEQGVKKGIEQGVKKGKEQGELIGEIRAIQQIMKQRRFSKAELSQKNIKELKTILKQLRSEL
jgi:predicted transposase YdaD